jgi:hypothetical protein
MHGDLSELFDNQRVPACAVGFETWRLGMCDEYFPAVHRGAFALLLLSEQCLAFRKFEFRLEHAIARIG